MRVQELFDEATSTLTYVAWDEATRDAVVIDSVLDYDPAASRISTRSADRVIECVKREALRVHYILDTHAHADHLSALGYLREKLHVPSAMSRRITRVQELFKDVFDLEGLAIDGRQFDRLLDDYETIAAGSLDILVLPTPGHTPACVSYRIRDAVFTGDALFIEDYGTGRTDFPGGSAADLYHSVHEVLYGLPEDVRVFVGHDYRPGGRPLRCETTIGASKRANVQLRAETTEAAFIEFRNKRDATLSQPKLLFPSVQVNIAAGALPARGYFAVPFTAPPELRVESSAWSSTRISVAHPDRRAAGT
jgi:glyoxylase-like metal-dependent hydrolase (beta-lactamase superfamily II)